MKLLSIENIKKQTCYDIEISNTHCFFANGVLAHNSNAGITCYQGEIAAQRKGDIIAEGEKGDYGFRKFVFDNEDIFKSFFNEIADRENINNNEVGIAIYGEFVGKGIQKGVAISQIDKALFIFSVKIFKPNDENFKSYWVDHTYLRNPDSRIFNISDYDTYEIDIDFEMPKLSVNKMIEITEAVEKQCPVGKAFGIDGIGEGVVWKITYKGTTHLWKVKGDKHSVTKTKQLTAVDTEKLNSIKEFVDYAVTENRIEQGLSEVFSSRDEWSKSKTPDFLRWVIRDIMEEEKDTMEANGLEPKDVNKYISNKARNMFFNKLDF